MRTLLDIGLMVFGFGIAWSAALLVSPGADPLSPVAGGCIGVGALLVARAIEGMLKR